MAGLDFYVAYEDILTKNVIEAVFRQSETGHRISQDLHQGGSGYLKKNLPAFNRLADHCPVLLITDLDAMECPASLIQDWFAFPRAKWLVFCVAVREVESWIMADLETFAQCLGVPGSKIIQDPESLPDPRQHLINLARNSRKKHIREGVVPKGSARIGPAYNEILRKFVKEDWRMKQAMKRSGSLRRMVEKLQEIA